jgi:hypothetical protein
MFTAMAVKTCCRWATAEVANSAITLVTQYFGLPSNNQIATNLSTWLTAGLVVGIAGYALWRAVSYAILTARPVPSGWPAGFWLGAGMAAGELTTFRTVGAGRLPAAPSILLALVVGGLVFTWWVAQSTWWTSVSVP